MACGIQRLAAERTWCAAGHNDCRGRRRELHRLRRAESHPQQVIRIWVVVGDLRIVAFLVHRTRLDEDGSAIGIPSKREDTHPE